jgi:Bacterial protein of unknown function (DUF853)
MARSKGMYLGLESPLDGSQSKIAELPTHHLVTHGVVVGMTGSGKTGLLTVMVEEALRAQVPTLVIDVKGDLPNLLLAFSSFESTEFLPWVDSCMSAVDERAPEQVARELAQERATGLQAWGLGEKELRAYRAGVHVRVLTPGSNAGEPLHVLSALERRSPRWDTDLEAARAALSAAVSLLLRLVGRDPDPAKSREHVLLAILAEARLRAGQSAELGALLEDLAEPPIERVGALALDQFISKKDRAALAASLNTLLGSPTFSAWREGATLDVGAWLAPHSVSAEGGAPQVVAPGKPKTPAVIVSVAHLDDDERALVLGLVLEEVLSWVRSLPGSRRLRALIVFDEVYGFMPPHPANPPTKGPLVALLKQARAFGVGVLVATQNPMDLDYRALSNAGLWCVGRLQTDADRARIVDGLRTATGVRGADANLDHTLQQLAPRWFVMRNAHASDGSVLLQPRWALSFLRGPMTRSEIRAAREGW